MKLAMVKRQIKKAMVVVVQHGFDFVISSKTVILNVVISLPKVTFMAPYTT